MRLFELLGLQHTVLYLFPAFLFVVIFGIALGFSHIRTARSEERFNKIHSTYPEDLEDRNAPFPLALTIIIAGTILWSFFYILGIGIFGVKI